MRLLLAMKYSPVSDSWVSSLIVARAPASVPLLSFGFTLAMPIPSVKSPFDCAAAGVAKAAAAAVRARAEMSVFMGSVPLVDLMGALCAST